MLTREQIIEQVKSGRKSACLDGRDYGRLINFFPADQWEIFGMKLKDGAQPPAPKDLTEANVINQLREDVAFGFEKALNQRGLSASFMHSVIKMWMWVLEDELYDEADDLYAQYGLPFLKAVACKYKFPNEIGDDYGDESKYAEGDW